MTKSSSIKELSRIDELNNINLDISIKMDEDHNITSVDHNLKEIILRAYQIGHMEGLISANGVA